MLDRLPVSVARLDPQMRVTFINRRLATYLNIPEDRALGRTMPELGMTRETWGEWVPHARRAFASGQPEEFECVCRHGALERFIQYRFAPEFGPDGTIVALLVVALANDEVHKLRDTLCASETRFEAFMNAMPILVWLRDDEHRYVYTNPHYCEIMRIAPEEWYGKSLDEVWPAEVAKQFLHNDRLAAESPVPIEVRESAVTPDGVHRHWMNVKFCYRDPAGHRFHGGLGLDITRQMEMEDETRRLEKRLYQSQKLESLGILAGGVAHDFNNLLTAILGNLSLAKMQAPPSGPLVDCLGKVEHASMRAAELCQQMLAYSGRGCLAPKEFDLNELVRELSGLLGPLISSRAEVVLDLAPGALPIRGDATQLRQVAMNLLTNASEAIGDRPGTIRIRTAKRTIAPGHIDDGDHPHEWTPGDYAVLEVTDSGCGMDAATQARIFEPFFSTKFTGRGLGLAAVQGILRGHKGGIRVASEPGRGSTFTVLLPAFEPPKAKPASRERVLGRSGLGKLILIIDDEADVRAVMQRVLEVSGFSVLHAADGLEGVATYREHKNKVNLVLLDLSMPRQSGAETFRQIRAIRPDAQVILTSGFGPNQALEEFEGHGLAAFLRKPFRVEELLDAVFKVLQP